MHTFYVKSFIDGTKGIVVIAPHKDGIEHGRFCFLSSISSVLPAT